MSESWASGLTRPTVPDETRAEILAENIVSALGGKTRKLSSTVTVKHFTCCDEVCGGNGVNGELRKCKEESGKLRDNANAERKSRPNITG